MALLGSSGKKEGPKQISLDSVIGMKNQGYTNDQIFQLLSGQGYEQNQIYDALNQADIKMTMEYPQAPPQYNMPDMNSGMGGMGQDQYGQYGASQPAISQEKIEEIVEAMVSEKWEQFNENLDKLTKWKEKTDAKLVELEENIKHLKDDFDKVHNAILLKVGDYDAHITNVSTTLKAMEQAFTKVLPVFVENVSELSRITKSARDSQKK